MTGKQEQQEKRGQQGQREQSNALTHINEQGRARMVDISAKQDTVRSATAQGLIKMNEHTLKSIKNGKISKGDVLAVSQVAGVMAAKNTSSWIPMCHPIPLTGVNILFSDNGKDELYIEATVKTYGKTGVEMEALTAVSAAALTVYDMCKAIDREMEIARIWLTKKTGGKSGDYTRTPDKVEET